MTPEEQEPIDGVIDQAQQRAITALASLVATAIDSTRPTIQWVEGGQAEADRLGTCDCCGEKGVWIWDLTQDEAACQDCICYGD